MGARVVWDHEVAGSNPVTPTIFYNLIVFPGCSADGSAHGSGP